MKTRIFKSITRRNLLKGSATIATGVAVGACSEDSAVAGDPTDAASMSIGHELPDMVWKEEEEYEFTRIAKIWNQRKPDRYPAVIAEATSQEDCIAAVKFAKEHGLEVCPKATGHNRNANFMRDGSMLLDTSGMTKMEVDYEKGVAIIEPGVRGGQLLSEIMPKGYFFPTAHDATVGLCGFIMGSGIGWCLNRYGVSSSSLLAVDVINAEGEVVHSNDESNSDYVWCARGAAPAVFGVVTKLYLKLHPAPGAIRRSKYIYPKKHWEEITQWLMDEVQPKASKDVEIYSFCHLKDGGMAGSGKATSQLWLTAMSDTAEEAEKALEIFETCPVIDEVLVREYAEEVDMASSYSQFSTAAPAGYRYFVDVAYFSMDTSEFFDVSREYINDLPTPESNYLLISMHGIEPHPNAAISGLPCDWMGAVVGIARNPSEDEAALAWAVASAKALEPYTSGIPMMDENLISRPVKNILEPEKWKRYEAARAELDPNHLFRGFLLGKA